MAGNYYGGNRKSMDPNTIYHSEYGDYMFIEEAGYKYFNNNKRTRLVKIRFILTGYETIVPFTQAYNGKVADPYYPRIFGVGYLGNLDGLSHGKKEYGMWYNMMKRNYDITDPYYKFYGGIGVIVDPRWHSFENFLRDLQTLPGYSDFKHSYKGNSYQLDKDMLQANVPMNQRVYSKDTCMLIPTNENVRFTNIDKETSSVYLGVHKLANGNFQSRIMIDNIDIFLGTYRNEIAAANMYNHIISRLNLTYSSVLLNNVPFISIKDCLHFKNRKYPIKLPPGLKVPEIEDYNKWVTSGDDVYSKVKNNINKNKKQMYYVCGDPEYIRKTDWKEKYGFEFL